MERFYSDGASSDSSSYPELHHGSSSPAALDASGSGNAGRNGGVKYCGVCGDVAKSYHFGGLSCDSCKAFFRRSVQNDNYLHFQCCHRGQCTISLSNRKSCQYCRMKRCFAIGMEKSWVMTEEERKALMKARAEKKSSKKTSTSSSSSPSLSAVNTLNQNSSSSSGDQSPGVASNVATNEYEPQIDRMIEFLAPLEIKEIESIVTKYMHAYQHVPYRTELRFYDNDRPGVQVMEMFGTLIRRFAFYARLMADFSSLPFQDQSILLKGGVLEMCLLRGALVFDPQTNRWPNANMSMYKDAPVLKLDNIGHLTSTRLFQMHLDFISCIQQMSVDEPTIMLLVLVVLFTPERAGLVHSEWIEKYQAYYTSLLEHYLNWRFGPVKAKFMFGKMLTKLSDLRELSDTHNHYNLRLDNDEVSSIQNQLNSLKLNPYPELKVISEDNDPLPTVIAGASSQPCGDGGISQPQTYDSSSSYQNQENGKTTLNAKEISNCLSDVELASSPSYQQSPSPTSSSTAAYAQQQQQLDPSLNAAYHYQPNGGTNGLNAQQLHQMQFLAQHQMPPMDKEGQAYGMGQQQPMTNMALQFMQAMQQSVHQVASAPHFGFEWVKPDYQFDPVTTFAESNQSELPVNNDIPLKTSPATSVNNLPLTDGDMEELYSAIEGYSGKEQIVERLLPSTAHIQQ